MPIRIFHTCRRSAAVLVLLALAPASLALSPGDFFGITVVDDATGRGVPLVELKTTNGLRYYTDSGGMVAFHEPGLMNRKVFFHVRSHGYEFPADGFGYRGRALETVPGGEATLRIKRINIAERLYRVTGAGIYGHSVLTGKPVPLQKPLLNAQVTGSDSVVNALFQDRVYWFWGDTNRIRYPLGNFHVPGATSGLPGAGGLDPGIGVDLAYFTNSEGFAKPTARFPGEGPTWISGLIVLPAEAAGDAERMLAHYVRVRNDPEKWFEVYERGLAEFDDREKRFRKVTAFNQPEPFPHGAHAFLHREDGVLYIYYADPYPRVRVRALPEHMRAQEDYESFTCLLSGSRANEEKVDRDEDGRSRFGWKANTGHLEPGAQTKLAPGDHPWALRDFVGGKTVRAHRGTVYPNAYRNGWVMIFGESGGTSLLGEIWYAEAPTPLGPWVYARKIVTHEKYSFYNPKHHPLFDKDNGRILFFEGTYTHTFSGNPDQTPRYDYNQIMYRLTLDDPRLDLPEPVARMQGERGRVYRLPRPGVNWEDVEDIPFFAYPADRRKPGTIPLFARTDGKAPVRLTTETAADPEAAKEPFCYVLPAQKADDDIGSNSPDIVPLFEFEAEETGEIAYATGPKRPDGKRTWHMKPEPVCRVWRNPVSWEMIRPLGDARSSP